MMASVELPFSVTLGQSPSGSAKPAGVNWI